MKKIFLYVFLLVSLFACEKIDKYSQFSIQTKTIFEVPADVSVQTPIELNAQLLKLDATIFEDFNTSIDYIDKATIKNIKLKIINSQNINFNFLTDIELYIEADDLPKIRLAWLNDIQDDNVQMLDLEYLPDNLSGYLKSNQVKINLILLTDEVLSQPVQVEVEASFFINAEKLGKQ